MHTSHPKTGAGIAALITGSLIVLTPFHSIAANPPAPDASTKPKPASLVEYPCPAADTVPQCDITRSRYPAADPTSSQPPDPLDTANNEIDVPDFNCAVWLWGPIVPCLA